MGADSEFRLGTTIRRSRLVSAGSAPKRTPCSCFAKNAVIRASLARRPDTAASTPRYAFGPAGRTLSQLASWKSNAIRIRFAQHIFKHTSSGAGLSWISLKDDGFSNHPSFESLRSVRVHSSAARTRPTDREGQHAPSRPQSASTEVAARHCVFKRCETSFDSFTPNANLVFEKSCRRSPSDAL